MHLLYSIFLQIFHWIYAVYLFVCSLRQGRQQQKQLPQPLLATRSRFPKHLAIIFDSPEDISKESISSAIIESVTNTVSWCRQLGIAKLTIYEQHGALNENEHEIRTRLAPNSSDCESSESEIEYRPLTPPPSDYSESRPLSPSHSPSLIPVTTILISDLPKTEERSGKRHSLRKRRGGDDKQSQSRLQLCLISKDASKNAIAAVATSLAQNFSFKQRKGGRSAQPNDFSLSMDALDVILEGEEGLSSPDFMIVHSLSPLNTSRKVPLELQGFPPWHIRLTEIYSSRIYEKIGWPLIAPTPRLAHPLDESVFCAALDEFAGAEMRFGK